MGHSDQNGHIVFLKEIRNFIGTISTNDHDVFHSNFFCHIHGIGHFFFPIGVDVQTFGPVKKPFHGSKGRLLAHDFQTLLAALALDGGKIKIAALDTLQSNEKNRGISGEVRASL